MFYFVIQLSRSHYCKEAQCVFIVSLLVYASANFLGFSTALQHRHCEGPWLHVQHLENTER